MEKLLAVDLALLPPIDVMEWLIGLIQYAPDSVIRLDKVNCLPHVTLAMGVLRESDILKFGDRIRKFQDEAARVQIVPSQTRLYTLENGKKLGEVCIAMTPQLRDFRERIAGAIRSMFVGTPATVDMFFAPPVVDPISTTWILKFGEKFRPHVTLGEGKVAQLNGENEFFPSRLALCQLGNYCTCRRVLI